MRSGATAQDGQGTSSHAGRPQRRRLGLFALPLVALGVLGGTLLAQQPSTTAQACTAGNPTGLRVGQCAPDFTLSDLQGQPISLHALRGRPVLLHFWAVGCTTCAAEYGDFARAIDTAHSRELAVLAVDAWGEPAPMVQEWRKTHSLAATFLIDPPSAVYALYGGAGTPTSVFIDRTGHITYLVSGALTLDDYRTQLHKITA